MKKILIATAVTLMCSSAFAQGTGPTPQTDNMTKPGTTNSTMDNGSMDKGGAMNNTTGMGKDNMKKDMSKDGSPNANTKKNDGMSK